MARRLPILLVIAILLALVPARTAEAQRRTLRVGDQAPALDAEEWVNGGPVTFENGTTYFVFFFEEPRRDIDGMLVVAVLEWLRTMSAMYDFEVVGITGASKADVQQFSRDLGDDPQVAIGIDDRQRVRRAWVGASSAPTVNGSTMFVVDASGRIQYFGTGGEEEREELFPLILSQRYDASLMRRTEPLRRAKDTARQVGNWRLFEQHHAELMELDPRVFALENIEKFESLLLDRGDREAAYAFVAELQETYADDPRLLLDLAGYIADSPKLSAEQRDLDVALALVLQAKEGMRSDNPRPLAMEALVHLRKGDFPMAVRMQRRAFRVAPTAMKPRYLRTLESYQEIRDQRRDR